jgi:hypothetical protein
MPPVPVFERAANTFPRCRFARMEPATNAVIQLPLRSAPKRAKVFTKLSGQDFDVRLDLA